MQKNVENKTKTNDVIYRAFIAWFALPYPQRMKTGIRNQQKFAEAHGINNNTLTRWKERPDFEKSVDALIQKWGVERIPDVIDAIARSAIKGNARSQALWMRLFGQSFLKKRDESRDVYIREGDIRYLIEMLPEPLKSEHYANLRKLLDDSVAYRDKDPDNPMWAERSPEEEV